MFIHVTTYDGTKLILVNLHQVRCINIRDGKTAIFFNGEDPLSVRETVEELYDRIRSMSNGKLND